MPDEPEFTALFRLDQLEDMLRRFATIKDETAAAWIEHYICEIRKELENV